MQGGNPDWKRAFPAGKAKGRKKYAGGEAIAIMHRKNATTAKTEYKYTEKSGNFGC